MSAARSIRFAICSVALVSFCLFLWPRTASADPIVYYNGKTYDISITPSESFSSFTTATSQPWWGFESVAEQFAGSVGGYFGPDNTNIGPLFAYNYYETQQSYYVFNTETYCTLQSGCEETGSNGPGVGDYYPEAPNSALVTPDFYWAVATIVNTPEPGTLSLLFVGLLGLGLLAGVKRYRGNRLQIQE